MASPNKNQFILRCNIYENKNGVCLLEKVWHWPIQASPHDISKMLMSFNQMSSQLGNKNKDVNEIVFDATAHLKVPKNIGRRRKKLMMTQEKSTLAFQKLRLVNTKLDCVSIGLFHTLTRDESTITRVSEFLEDLIQEFKSRGFLDKVIENKDLFADIAADKKDIKMDVDDIMNLFKDFEPVVEVLSIKHQVDVYDGQH